MPEHLPTRQAPAADIKALPVILEIMTQLERSAIAYCHWKSNYHIRYALSGVEDVDILIEAHRWSDFVEILGRHGFKAAESTTSRHQPGVFHFLGNEDASGTFINVHAYARILTGDHFLKSWALPFERLLLANTVDGGGIRIPEASSELIIFVIRNMLKMTTLIDLFYAQRSVAATIEERAWLLERADLAQTRARLARHFPEIAPQDFERALELLRSRGQVFAKIKLGLRFSRLLSKYRRYGAVRQSAVSLIYAARLLLNKFVYRQKHMQLLTGGKIIAFVGPQATGKSTLAKGVSTWLGAELGVRTIHAGKPPSTILTVLPSRLIPLARRLLPGQMTVKVEKQLDDNPQANCSVVFILRKLMLAYERRALLRRVFRQSRNGKIVLSDRYPSDIVGAIDGATFTDATIDCQSSAVKRRLMRIERSLYDSVCPPDLVIRLTVSVEMAVHRNRTRDKKGDQSTEYVRLRHAMQRRPEFRRCPTVEISTDAELADTLLAVKRAVWAHL